jgi:hypothetical protein
MILPAVTKARNAARMHVGISFEPFERINKRYPVALGPQDAPDPVRDSRFVGGRGRPVLPAQRNTALTCDPYNWSLWEQDQFRGTHYKVYFNAMSKGVPIARGPSWGERANIADPQPVSYGDSVGEVAGNNYDDAVYFPGGF